MYMKKYVRLTSVLMSFMIVMTLSSCFGKKAMVLPMAVNTVNTVGLSELNLERKDYEVLDRITAEATITYKEIFGGVKIIDDNGECEVTYKKTKTGLTMSSFKGFFKVGYLHGNHENASISTPEDFARKLATYRLINISNEMGADGIVEPVVSTSVAQEGKNTVIFKTTVSGKAIRLKTND